MPAAKDEQTAGDALLEQFPEVTYFVAVTETEEVRVVQAAAAQPKVGVPLDDPLYCVTPEEPPLEPSVNVPPLKEQFELVLGAVPAPPPNTHPFAARSADDCTALVELA